MIKLMQMKFDIVTIFPGIFNSYFDESILKRAQAKKLVEIKIHNLRDYTKDKRKTIDDTPYGGGAGMVMMVKPIYECIKKIKKSDKSRIILFSAKGKKYTQADARRLAKYNNLTFICGRYEGVDERVAENLADEEISIGDYILTGGEIPAMVLVDSISRLIPGILGNPKSLDEESFGKKIRNSVLEYPQYTKPEDFAGWKVPKILLSGDHQKIKEWRNKNSKIVK